MPITASSMLKLKPMDGMVIEMFGQTVIFIMDSKIGN